MKEELIKLAKEKGFTSSFLYNTPYNKHIKKEQLRWYFWLCELQKWLMEKHKISVYGKPSQHSDGWDFRIHRKGISPDMEFRKDYEIYEEGLKRGLQDALNLI
jgi:hypothetical protein